MDASSDSTSLLRLVTVVRVDATSDTAPCAVELTSRGTTAATGATRDATCP